MAGGAGAALTGLAADPVASGRGSSLIRVKTPTADEPGWDFKGVDPRLLFKGKDDERGRFFLSLALVYNDLKGIAFLQWLAKEREVQRPEGEVSAEAGNFNGTQLQLTRYLAGLLYELCKLIEEHHEIVQSMPVTALVARTPMEARASWNRLVDVALKREGRRDELRTLLERIRDNLTFHYYKPKDLSLGFERHFFELEKTAHNESAYYSPGKTMEFTRFFYADAAAQAGVLRWAAIIHIEKATDEISALAGKVNVALRFIVEEFILERSKGKPSPSGGRRKRGR